MIAIKKHFQKIKKYKSISHAAKLSHDVEIETLFHIIINFYSSVNFSLLCSFQLNVLISYMRIIHMKKVHNSFKSLGYNFNSHE